MIKGLNRDRRRFLSAAAMTLAAVPFGATGCGEQRMTSADAQLPIEGELPSLGGANTWLNSQPLTADSVRGKVALFQFCTYTCINWLRTLAYVRAWDEKYRGQGLAVVGVHTPEFEFEKDLDNVRRALKGMGVAYPVAVDNDYEVWR